MKKWQTDRDTGIAGARFRRTVLSVGDISASEAQLVRPGWEVGLGNTTEQRCGLLFTSSQRCWVYFTVRLRKQFQLMSVGDISGRKQYSRLCGFFWGGGYPGHFLHSLPTLVDGPEGEVSLRASLKGLGEWS